jgi:hypothetical protein
MERQSFKVIEANLIPYPSSDPIGTHIYASTLDHKNGNLECYCQGKAVPNYKILTQE